MVKHQNSNTAEHEVAIIGGGFGGLGTAIRLLQEGKDNFILFERAKEIGGTWRDNIYPGCACDVPSNLYSFSFEQNPEWSRLFPRQPEILDYLNHCVDKYNLKPYIRCNTAITKLEFDEQEGFWRIYDQHGQCFTARLVVSATGPLNRPNIPDIKGLNNFKGPYFHSSEWDYSVDLKNKTIGVIGTGASAIQFVPEIAPEVKQLYLFQRTPPWIVPRPDKEVSGWKKRLYRRFPLLQHLVRSMIYWTFEFRVLGLMGNRRILNYMSKLSREHLEEQVTDPDLLEKLRPNYEIGCKRVLVSDNYYPTLARENIELVTEGIQEIKTNGILSKTEVERNIDVLIFATGFHAAEFDFEVAVKGLNGQSLNEQWSETGPQAYSGTAISGYPNLLLLVGPNTGLGHNSIVHIIESQVNYVIDYLRILNSHDGSTYLDVKADAQKAFNRDIQEKLATTVWQTGGCKSWYQTAEGKNTTLWPGSTVKFRKMTRKVNLDDFNLITADEKVSV